MDNVHVYRSLNELARLFHNAFHHVLRHDSTVFAERDCRLTCNRTNVAARNTDVNFLYIHTAQLFSVVHSFRQSGDRRLQFICVTFLQLIDTQAANADLVVIIQLSDKDADFGTTDIETDDDSVRIDASHIVFISCHHLPSCTDG